MWKLVLGFFANPVVRRVLSIAVIIALCFGLVKCFYDNYIEKDVKIATHEQTVETLTGVNTTLAEALQKEKQSRVIDDKAQVDADAQKQQLADSLDTKRTETRKTVKEAQAKAKKKAKVVKNSTADHKEKSKQLKQIYTEAQTEIATTRINHLWNVYCEVSPTGQSCPSSG